MNGAKFAQIFLLLHSGIFGCAKADTNLPQLNSTHPPQPNPLELSNQRTTRQIQPSQSIFASKNFIKSKLPQNSGQPQLFNLGYSVRFENQPNQNQNIQRTFDKTQFSNIQQGDIITGTRKQNTEVDLPGSPNENPQFTPEIIKKRKIFGSKTPIQSQDSDSLYSKDTSQSYVSATTQRSLEALGKIKDVDYQQDLSELYQQKYTWRNPSPNVKIIRSTEIPTERIENRALNFDHEKALSKSEGFGFSDAMRDENLERGHFPFKETFNRIERIQTTSKPEEFRIIQVQEPINEPPMKTQVVTHPVVPPPSQNLEQDNFFRTAQIKPQTKLVKLPPTALLQAVDGTPLNPQLQTEIITSQIPKQAYIQHIMMPQIQYESTPKYRGKYKYVKRIPGSRGNLVYTRKATGNLDYTKKTKNKLELRREFKPPPMSGMI